MDLANLLRIGCDRATAHPGDHTGSRDRYDGEMDTVPAGWHKRLPSPRLVTFRRPNSCSAMPFATRRGMVTSRRSSVKEWGFGHSTARSCAREMPSIMAAGPSPTISWRGSQGRQVEILQLLADGRSNREIAGALYIAEGTVKAHMHQLFGKPVARNRTEAVAKGRDLSLIP